MARAWALTSTRAANRPYCFSDSFAARNTSTGTKACRSRSASPRPRTTRCAFVSPFVRSRTTLCRPARSAGCRPTSGARTICVRNLGDFLPLVMAGLVTTALSAQGGSRVIVSTTLDSTLEIFDADSLAELQSPLPSKGGGPVRLWVQNFDGKEYLFAANHGAVLGSVGVFDLSAEQVMEVPLSPFAARAGSVGIAAGELSIGATQVPTVFVTNTQSAVAAVAGLGCSLPNGSVTAYDASLLSTVGLLQEIGTVDVSAPVPYAVSVDPAGARAFASTNCGDALDTLTVGGSGADGSSLVLTRTATRSTGASPDGTIYDGA